MVVPVRVSFISQIDLFDTMKYWPVQNVWRYIFCSISLETIIVEVTWAQNNPVGVDIMSNQPSNQLDTCCSRNDKPSEFQWQEKEPLKLEYEGKY